MNPPPLSIRRGLTRLAAALSACFAFTPASGLDPGPAPVPSLIEVQARVINSFKANEPELRQFGAASNSAAAPN